jgi:hypothetical protein
MNGLKASVHEELPRLRFKSFESQSDIALVMQRGEPEGDPRRNEVHALSSDKTGSPEYRHGLNHSLLPTKEMDECLFIERKIQSHTPIGNQRHQRFAKRVGAAETRVQRRVAQIRYESRTRDASHRWRGV